VGKRIFALMTQSPTDTYSLLAQQLMLDIVLHADTVVPFDMSTLKLNVKDYAAKITSDDMYDVVRDELKSTCMPEGKSEEATKSQTASDQATSDEEPKGDEQESSSEESKQTDSKEDKKADKHDKKEKAEVKS
jgi:cobalamin biosynthesis protein CobT